jgi:hypothetical protein
MFGVVPERFNRTANLRESVFIPYLIRAKILTFFKPPATGRRKDFSADKIRDEDGFTQILFRWAKCHSDPDHFWFSRE